MIILEDVEGDTATVGIGTDATRFDEITRETQEVLDSVEWADE